MAFLKCYWKTLAPWLEHMKDTKYVKHNQQSLCDAFFMNMPLKNSEVIRGKKGRWTIYEISDKFWEVVHGCRNLDYHNILVLVLASLERNINENKSHFYAGDKKAAALSFLFEVRTSVLSWFDNPHLYAVVLKNQKLCETEDNPEEVRDYKDHKQACDLVFTACLATLYYYGLQLRTLDHPQNDYLDVLSYVCSNKGRLNIWADIFSLDERVSVFVTGSPVSKQIGTIEVDLKNTTFLLPFPGANTTEVIVPNGNEWSYARKLLSDSKDDLIILGKEIYDSLRQNTNGMRENTPIVGVLTLSSVHSGDMVKCELYQTDYFTHRVIERLKELKDINARTIAYPFSEDRENAWRRTSLGVNVILVLDDSKKIILVKRSKLAQYGNEGKIYPSVVETIDLLCRKDGKTPDDFNEKEYTNTIVRATVRGLSEELGITPDMYQTKDIHVCSVFHTRDYDQDNFFVVVILHNTDYEDIKNCIRNAPDYHIENSDIYTIKNNAQDIIQHILVNQDIMINQTIYCLVEYVRRFLRIDNNVK